MLYAILAFGALCAVAGALYRRRAAFVLLLSTAVALALDKVAGVPFNLWLWLAMDALAIAAIVWPTEKRPEPWRQDWPILVLYPYAIAAYGVEPGYAASVLLVSAMMAFTFPAKLGRFVIRFMEDPSRA